jgi:hypothetical protein
MNAYSGVPYTYRHQKSATMGDAALQLVTPGFPTLGLRVGAFATMGAFVMATMGAFEVAMIGIGEVTVVGVVGTPLPLICTSMQFQNFSDLGHDCFDPPQLLAVFQNH